MRRANSFAPPVPSPPLHMIHGLPHQVRNFRLRPGSMLSRFLFFIFFCSVFFSIVGILSFKEELVTERERLKMAQMDSWRSPIGRAPQENLTKEGAVEKVEFSELKEEIGIRNLNLGNVEFGGTGEGLRKCILTLNRGELENRTKRPTEDICWSRTEQPLYRCSRNSVGPPTAKFTELLNRYATLHRNCTQHVTNWTTYFLTRGVGGHRGVPKEPTTRQRWRRRIPDSENSASNSDFDFRKCQFLVWLEPPAGLGNRLSSLVGAFLYAVLTERVLLVNGNPSLLPRLLCEPFPESSWYLPQESASSIISELNNAPRVGEVLDGKPTERNGTETRASTAYIYLLYDFQKSDWSFFCAKGQKALHEKQWVAYMADEYVGPAFYFLESFRKILDDVSPERHVFTHLARHLLSPSNFMWERITRIYRNMARDVTKTVGVQVRTFNAYENVNVRIYDCLTNTTKTLPEAVNAEEILAQEEGPKNVNFNPRGKFVSVFLTSLQSSHYEYLKSRYTDGTAADGTVVSVYSESHQEAEDYGTWGWNQTKLAFTEIWVLSFTDELFITYTSSFGYLAAGLAGIRPYILNVANRFGGGYWRTNKRGVCELGRGPEPCYQTPPFLADCVEHNGTDIGEVVPHVKRCLDFPRGVQVVSNMMPSLENLESNGSRVGVV